LVAFAVVVPSICSVMVAAPAASRTLVPTPSHSWFSTEP
jgi:hypothetical protein